MSGFLGFDRVVKGLPKGELHFIITGTRSVNSIVVPKLLLAQIVKDTALQYGDFILKSGKRSHFYLDLRNTHLSPALSVVVNAIHYELRDFEFDAIGGPCVGADPIVGGYLYALAAHKPNLRGFLVRKQEKGHGMDGLVIGPVKPGDKCVMIEDVSTTGGSMMEAIAHVQLLGANVALGIAVVDRSEGKAAELLNRAGVGYISLLTLEDLDIDPAPPNFGG